MVFCYKCDAEQTEGSEFCNKCGAKIVSGNGNTAKTEINSYSLDADVSVKKKSKAKVIILIVIGIIALLVVLAIIADDSDDSSYVSNDNKSESRITEDNQNAKESGEVYVTPDGNFEWVEYQSVKYKTDDWAYITGKLKNISGEDLYNIYIHYNLYDKDGNFVGTAGDTTLNLKPGNTWEYEADILVSLDVARYEFDRIDFEVR